MDRVAQLEKFSEVATRYYHCPNYHELAVDNKPKRRGMFSSGDRIKCHFCKLGIKLEAGYWTCKEDCDFDVCNFCQENYGKKLKRTVVKKFVV